MIVPFILIVLQPLCPALFLRETLRWFIGSVGDWLIDEDYAGWLKQSGDEAELRALLSFVLYIEEGLAPLSMSGPARSWAIAPGRGKGPGVRPIPRPAIRPPSRRSACASSGRVSPSPRSGAWPTGGPSSLGLLAKAELRLEVVHHPIEAQPPAGGVGGGGATGAGLCLRPCLRAGERIRAPP
jgi:hypothetical protein